jgi:L-aspartate oxidase
MRYDLIIIGAGIAGLHAAIRFPQDKKVLVICKDNSWDCNTFYAQGGVAVPADLDDIPLHIQDTLKAGAGLCDKKAVEVLCNDGYKIVNELMDMGFELTKMKKENFFIQKRLRTAETESFMPEEMQRGDFYFFF